MENLIISKTNKTPNIEFSVNGKLSISGRGMAVDPEKFYKAAVEWIDTYVKNPSTVTELSITLEYVQSGDVRIIMEILQKLSPLSDTNHKVVINWYYELGDDDQKDLGDSLSKSMNTPFNLIELQ